MEEKLKQNYQLYISRINGGRLGGSFIKYNHTGGIEDLIEVTPTALASVLYLMPTVANQLEYGQRFVLSFNEEEHVYEAYVEERKTEGPYCEFVGYETIKKKKDPTLACSMTKLEESSLAEHFDSPILRKKISHHLEEKMKQGYDLWIRHDGMGKLDAALITIKENEAFDFIGLEEEKINLIQSFSTLEKELYKGGSTRSFLVHYDKAQDGFYASLKEMNYCSDGSNRVFWNPLEEVEGKSLQGTFYLMNREIKKENEKGKELKKCQRPY